MTSQPSNQTYYRHIPLDHDHTIFYREAGINHSKTIVLLHGFPSSSHMFRDLIPKLAKTYHVIAPDLPGFGQTLSPSRQDFTYSFDNLANVIQSFLDNLGLERFALYVFDYGAPIGYRIAMNHPERIQAIISQNGNAYLDGFSENWDDWENYWRNPSPATREACHSSLSTKTIRDSQYLHGTADNLVSPDGYTLDLAYLARPEAQDIQLDLIGDYHTNVSLYPAFQAYFREFQPPLLATWGQHDPFFIPAGAKAYVRDLPEAEIHLLDTGHFALETHADHIATLIEDFLSRKL